MRNTLITFSFLLCSLATAAPVNTGHAEASLVTNLQDTQQESFYLGVRLKMKEGWHTYWENPGDSGGAFEASWVQNEDIIIENVEWPTPVTIPYPPLMTYGYEGDVIFPFKVFRAIDSDLSIVSLKFSFLICSDICIPEEAELNIDLSTAKPSLMLEQTIKNLPIDFLDTKTSVSDETIKIQFQAPKMFSEAYFFPREDGLFTYTSVQDLNQIDNQTFEISIPALTSEIESFSGILRLDSQGYQVKEALEISTPTMSLFSAIIFALLGGLILNLMPCVFPVISLKVLSFVAMGGNDHAKIRNHALTFVSGVLFTFLLIASTLIFIRSSGAMIGWGFQLQSPEIVGVLTLIMFGIGLILLTDINMAKGLTSIGSNAQSRNDYSGSFFTGVLAVVVASPCTAPFMGAAIGYALLQPSFATLPIFLALGIGFAGPYLALALKPQWISALPKPGAWMETLKQFFAFPMMATALWLMWVFMLQTSGDALIQLLVLSLALAISIWMIATFNNAIKWIGLTLTVVAGIQFFTNIPVTQINLEQGTTNSGWNVSLESDLQEKNQAYLINFTAAWCITCQANEKTSLGRASVKKYLEDNNIRYIKADWTNRDENITKSLSKYGRSGVPLYVFWKPGMQSSKILPAVLTEAILIRGMQ
jgi:thiol:disulfide interchange protein DsbD